MVTKSKPTVQSTYNELLRHETECAERWKTNFKVLDQVQNEVTFIRNWLIGGMSTLALTFLGFILTQVI